MPRVSDQRTDGPTNLWTDKANFRNSFVVFTCRIIWLASSGEQDTWGWKFYTIKNNIKTIKKFKNKVNHKFLLSNSSTYELHKACDTQQQGYILCISIPSPSQPWDPFFFSIFNQKICNFKAFYFFRWTFPLLAVFCITYMSMLKKIVTAKALTRKGRFVLFP